MDQEDIVVSVIIPVHNGEKWIAECMESIIRQALLPNTKVEICIYNDGSTDSTSQLIDNFQNKIHETSNLSMRVTHGPYPPKGVGYGKNRAVSISSGKYLCFQDIDDIMRPERIMLQLHANLKNTNALIGSRFSREPEGSTVRYTKWANELPQDLLTKQVFTSHGPTIIMPTWFCHRLVFDRVGGFSEAGRGTPEDLIFFYKHLDTGGDVVRVDKPLLVYRYHPLATTLSIPEKTIWMLRVNRLESKVLPHWNSFTIWNAGKQGRQLWKSLSEENQNKVVAFCDVDQHKIGTDYKPYTQQNRFSKVSIPIRYFRECNPPFVICVKLDMTGGAFEGNLQSLRLIEGQDYVIFS